MQRGLSVVVALVDVDVVGLEEHLHDRRVVLPSSGVERRLIGFGLERIIHI